MLARFFDAWERRLFSRTDDRVVRPFEWGLDWMDADGHGPATPPDVALADWARTALADSLCLGGAALPNGAHGV
jgi:hypothetical protein